MKVIKRSIITVGIISGVVNIFGLVTPLFMIEVYDRVIPSQSTQTLTALLVLVAIIYSFSIILDNLRYLIISRFASLIDENLNKKCLQLSLVHRLRQSLKEIF